MCLNNINLLKCRCTDTDGNSNENEVIKKLQNKKRMPKLTFTISPQKSILFKLCFKKRVVHHLITTGNPFHGNGEASASDTRQGHRKEL